jgi:hypothetical protein
LFLRRKIAVRRYSPRREKQRLQIWRQKMKRPIFGELVKISAENPCWKWFDMNPETSSRHVLGTVTDIETRETNSLLKTILQSGVPRRGVDLCQTLGAQSLPSPPVSPSPPFPPFPSSLVLLLFVLPSPPFDPLPLRSPSLGGPGATPPENFFSGTHART